MHGVGAHECASAGDGNGRGAAGVWGACRGTRSAPAFFCCWRVRSRPSRRGRCRPRFDLAAHFTKRWWRRFDAEIRPGTYELLSRAVDTAGQRERVFNTKRGNRRVFRIAD